MTLLGAGRCIYKWHMSCTVWGRRQEQQYCSVNSHMEVSKPAWRPSVHCNAMCSGGCDWANWVNTSAFHQKSNSPANWPQSFLEMATQVTWFCSGCLSILPRLVPPCPRTWGTSAPYSALPAADARFGGGLRWTSNWSCMWKVSWICKPRGSCVSGCPVIQQFSVGRLLGQQCWECFGCQQGCEPPSLLLLGVLCARQFGSAEIVKWPGAVGQPWEVKL